MTNKKIKKKKIYVLANPASGYRRYQLALKAARETFTPDLWDAEIRVLTSAQDLIQSAALARKNKAWAFVVCGGDGTLNAALAPLLGSTVRLGLIPMGTGNGFARGLKLPFDPLSACQSIARGKTKPLDIGLANGAPFANIFGTGIDAWIGETANRYRFLSRASGFIRYFISGVISAFTFTASTIRVKTGKTHIQSVALMVAIANAPEYGLGVKIAPLTIPDDGKFEMVFLPKLKPWQYITNFPRLYSGKPLSGSVTLSGKRFEIEQLSQGPSLPFHVDGEVVGTLPVIVKIKTKAIQLLVP